MTLKQRTLPFHYTFACENSIRFVITNPNLSNVVHKKKRKMLTVKPFSLGATTKNPQCQKAINMSLNAISHECTDLA